MSKLPGLVSIAIGATLSSASVGAAPMASHAGSCGRGSGAALAVQIAGFKARQGLLRVQTYGGDPATFFEKRAYIDRIEIPVPVSGSANVCVPVGHGGVYAVSVRHDLDGDRRSGRADGGGLSGNPRVSMTDLLFKRKPAPEDVSVRVGNGVTPVAVTLNYVQGMTFRPLAHGARR